MRAEGIAANGSRRVVLQDYELGVDNSVPGLFANAALVTQGDFHSTSAKSTIIGRDSSPASWIFTNRQIWEALEGEYFTTSHACGGGQVTFKVTDSAANPAADGMIDVAAIPVGTCPGVTALAANTMGTLLPFAIASSVDSMGRPVGTAFRQTIKVTDTSLYAPSNEIFIANGTATIEDVGVGTIDISWDVLPTGPVAEATPIRQHIPSVIAEGSHGGTDCPSESNSKFPQGCFFADLSNIWEKTFPGISMGEMLDLAQDNNAHYGPTAGTQGDWPTGPVSGVTWIDGAQTGDFNSGGSGGGGNGNGKGNGNGGGGSASSGGALCGEGIVILNTGVFGTNAENTSINLNVSGCEFKGVLYVIGDLGIQGNLESFSGTIIVETGVGTRVQGNGEKSFYDPVAIRRALAQLPPPAGKPGFVGAIPSTWRFGE